MKVEGGASAKVGMGNSPIGRFLGLLKAGFDIFANIRLDSQSREIVREVFNVSPKDVFEATNKVIEAYKEEILGHKKQLLLVFNVEKLVTDLQGLVLDVLGRLYNHVQPGKNVIKQGITSF